jgi:hypothetical protein
MAHVIAYIYIRLLLYWTHRFRLLAYHWNKHSVDIRTDLLNAENQRQWLIVLVDSAPMLLAFRRIVLCG